MSRDEGALAGTGQHSVTSARCGPVEIHSLGDGEGQGSLSCCSPWGSKESDVMKQLNNSNNWPEIISQKDGKGPHSNNPFLRPWTSPGLGSVLSHSS